MERNSTRSNVVIYGFSELAELCIELVLMVLFSLQNLKMRGTLGSREPKEISMRAIGLPGFTPIVHYEQFPVSAVLVQMFSETTKKITKLGYLNILVEIVARIGLCSC